MDVCLNICNCVMLYDTAPKILFEYVGCKNYYGQCGKLHNLKQVYDKLLLYQLIIQSFFIVSPISKAHTCGTSHCSRAILCIYANFCFT
jgi:hypothetical protein